MSVCDQFICFKWKFETLNMQPRHRYKKKRHHRYAPCLYLYKIWFKLET